MNTHSTPFREGYGLRRWPAGHAIVRREAAQHTGRTSCAFCNWAIEGALLDNHDQHQAHLVKAHPHIKPRTITAIRKATR